MDKVLWSGAGFGDLTSRAEGEGSDVGLEKRRKDEGYDDGYGNGGGDDHGKGDGKDLGYDGGDDGDGGDGDGDGGSGDGGGGGRWGKGKAYGEAHSGWKGDVNNEYGSGSGSGSGAGSRGKGQGGYDDENEDTRGGLHGAGKKYPKPTDGGDEEDNPQSGGKGKYATKSESTGEDDDQNGNDDSDNGDNDWQPTKSKSKPLTSSSTNPAPSSTSTKQVSSAGAKADCSNLALFYKAMGGTSWTATSGRRDETTVNCCAWYGVRCSSDQRVIALDLGGNGLSGVLDSSIFELSSLQRM